MKTGTITGTVTTPVVLGSGNYGATLTVAATGLVSPTGTYVAITGPVGLTGAVIDNLGSVTGGYFGFGAIYLLAGGQVINSGTLAGGNAPADSVHSGGIGVYLASGSVINTGLITGGQGGSYNGAYFGGGNGIDLGAAGRVSNAGTILGGPDGRSPGIGVSLKGGGVLTNSPGGYIYGAYGVQANSRASIRNAGVIRGGAGVGLRNGGTVINTGQITGTAIGVESRYDPVSVVNSGLISATINFQGVGLFAGGFLSNNGTIVGGAGTYNYYNGGNGVTIVGKTIAGENDGVVRGGAGNNTNASSNYYAGDGGVGVFLAGAGRFTNTFRGQISGGVGGEGGTASGYLVAGDGGVGVHIGAGVQFTNRGTITGGDGGFGPQQSGGAGGVGVVIDGGTLFAKYGLIAGGAGGGEQSARGDAVQFGKAAGTLVVSPGAVFVGDIAGNSNAADTLAFDGRNGTLTGLGDEVSGFTTIRIDPGAQWQLQGTLDGHGEVEVGAKATLQFYGTAVVPTIAFGAAGGATLLLGNPSRVTSTFSGFGAGDSIELKGIAATKLAYSAGTLTLFGAAGQVVDTLHFAGSYTAADFALHAFAQGTAVVFAGVSAAETLSGHFGSIQSAGLLLAHGSFAV